VLLTAIYVVGIIQRPARKFWGMGPDSIAVLIIYALGIAGLVLVG
jgi:cation:H+ antiporter